MPPVTAPPLDIALLDELVVQEFVHVREILTGATDAFLSGDREAARRLAARDLEMDALHARIEEAAAEGLLAPERGTAEERRLLVTVVRIAPELERSGDLASHIAALAGQGLGQWLTPRGRSLLAQMGAVGVEIWGMAEQAYVIRDTGAGPRLRRFDDEIDDLHVSLTAELASSSLPVPVAIESGLAARFYERLGDHAVNVACRLRFIAG